MEIKTGREIVDKLYILERKRCESHYSPEISDLVDEMTVLFKKKWVALDSLKLKIGGNDE